MSPLREPTAEQAATETRRGFAVARAMAARYGIVGVLLLILAVYLLSLTPNIGPFDSARYVILAKSIATGQGYRDLYRAGAPPHTLYPFGFPLLLSPVWLLWPGFPGNAVIFKLVPIVFAVATWLVFYPLLRRHAELGVPLSLAIILLSSLTPLMILFASQELMSETPYMFFSYLALFLFDLTNTGQDRSKLAFGGAILALVMGYFVRTVGLSLLIAATLYLALKRDFRRAALVFLTFCLLISPWAVRNWAVGASPLSGDYGQDMLLIDYARPDLGHVDSYWQLIPRALRNGYAHIQGSLLWILLPQLALERPASLPAFLYQDWVKVVIGVAITAAVALGAVMDCRRRKEVSVPALYALLYLGPVLLQPWVGARNLLPIAPLLFWYALTGIRGAANYAGRLILRRPAPSIGHWVTLGAVLVMLVSFARSDRLKIQAGMAYYSGAYQDPVERSFAEACRWITANTPQQGRFFATLPEWLFLYTEREAVSLPGGIDPYDSTFNNQNEFLSFLSREEVNYLVLQPERPSSDSRQYDYGESPLFHQTAMENPRRFALLLGTSSWPETLVYEYAQAEGQ